VFDGTGALVHQDFGLPRFEAIEQFGGDLGRVKLGHVEALGEIGVDIANVQAQHLNALCRYRMAQGIGVGPGGGFGGGVHGKMRRCDPTGDREDIGDGTTTVGSQ